MRMILGGGLLGMSPRLFWQREPTAVWALSISLWELVKKLGFKYLVLLLKTHADCAWESLILESSMFNTWFYYHFLLRVMPKSLFHSKVGL